jgi:hypothetical protein
MMEQLKKVLLHQLECERNMNPRMNMTDAQINDLVADMITQYENLKV